MPAPAGVGVVEAECFDFVSPGHRGCKFAWARQTLAILGSSSSLRVFDRVFSAHKLQRVFLVFSRQKAFQVGHWLEKLAFCLHRCP